MSNPARVLHPDDGDFVDLAGVGVRFLIDGGRSGGGFSCVEHPIAPRTLGSPIHTHTREDEYSFVLEGRIGVLLGDEVLEARAGDLVFKPRGEPHAFWNATDEPARFLEIISPAGFERYFAEAAVMFPAPGEGEPDMAAFAQLCERYGLEMDFESVPRLTAEHGLKAPPEGELADR
jgi:mannose-6-phosphate isomerase-like protein (cupin superfamily)